MGTLTDQDERALEMPAFLRRYQIDGETLARLIKSLGQVVSHLKYGDDARKFTENYDWKKVVVPLWLNLMEEIREETRPKSLEERRNRV